MDMPQDPVLLMSLVNTWLRDQYAAPTALCEDKGWEEDVLTARLEAAGFTYLPDQNQFR